MREKLNNLIASTIIYKYDLPNTNLAINKAICSTENDKCYSALNKESIADIIYNSIIEYSFNEFEIKGKDYLTLHALALCSKIKYNKEDSDESKIKYGFFGETILYSILTVLFKTKPLIARGYFYNPTDNSEITGFDSYHLIEHNNEIDLWFGEVKFHISRNTAVTQVLEKIKIVLSDEYLNRNFLSLHANKDRFNKKKTILETIFCEWEKKGCKINILEEIKQHKITLIYPILLLYEEDKEGYDISIEKAVSYIKEKYNNTTIKLSIPHSIFFIFLPVKEVKEIKKMVIEWIKLKKPLL